MVRRDNLADEQYTPQWRSRAEEARKRLSASVADALQEGSLAEDFDDEEEEAPSAPASEPAPPEGVLIPPRLSLQSRALAAVPPAPNSSELAPGATEDEQRRHRNVLAQFAQRVTSSFAALGGGRPTSPKADPVPSPLPPEVEVSSLLREPGEAPKVIAARVTADRYKQRQTGRMTRVRLEAAPRQIVGARIVSSEPVAPARTRPVAETPASGLQASLMGTGSFARGQSELAMTQPLVCASSVVLVMLAGDPGPVVVQYVSLLPGSGFTVHLSAPTTKETAFNYVVLLGAPS